MGDPLYASLVLRGIDDDEERAYRFEQFVRELIPWDFRPAAAGAFFEWSGWHFDVVTAARVDPIRRDSEEWRRLEGRVRQNESDVVGLFCSLGPADDVVEAAEALNRSGRSAIILHGGFWDELPRSACDATDVLRYAIASRRAAPPALADVLRWTAELDARARTVHATCLRASGHFLRRHDVPNHDELYVPRRIDALLEQAMRLLKPSRLAARAKRSAVSATDVPLQIFTVRDKSGAGKTMLAAQVARTSEPFVGVAREALEPGLARLDPSLDALIAVDRPLCAVIDELGATRDRQQTHGEVLSLLRSLDPLNEQARERGLLAFPLALVFTVDEDHWDRWASLFDGRAVGSLRMQLSSFAPHELDVALERYSSAYGYRLLRDLPRPVRAAIAHPFSLLAFSEANELQGRLRIDDAAAPDVLGSYLARKRANIRARGIPGLTDGRFMAVVGRVAYRMATRSERAIGRAELYRASTDAVPPLAGSEEAVARTLSAERILVPDASANGFVRFRHRRFLEYFAAYHIVLETSSGDAWRFGERIESLMTSAAISPFRVRGDVLSIVEREFPRLRDRFIAFYAASTPYMAAQLGRLRADLAYGGRTQNEELALVLEASDRERADIAWDAFFVLAAANSEQPQNRLSEAFTRAWDTNFGRHKRWKLLAKMNERGLLLEPAVVMRMLRSRTPKEWEVFLGSALAGPDRARLRALWPELDPPADLVALLDRGADEWRQAAHLLSIVRENRELISGELV